MRCPLGNLTGPQTWAEHTLEGRGAYRLSGLPSGVGSVLQASTSSMPWQQSNPLCLSPVTICGMWEACPQGKLPCKVQTQHVESLITYSPVVGVHRQILRAGMVTLYMVTHACGIGRLLMNSDVSQCTEGSDFTALNRKYWKCNYHHQQTHLKESTCIYTSVQGKTH